MINLTENAATHISNYLKNRGKGEGIRVGVKTSGCSVLVWLMCLNLSIQLMHMTPPLSSLG